MSEVLGALAEEAKAEQVEERVTIPAKILKMRRTLARSPEAFIQVWPTRVYVCNGHSLVIGFDWETGAKEKFQFRASALLNAPGVNEKNLRACREIEIIKRNGPDGVKLWFYWGFGTIQLNGGNPVECMPLKDLDPLLGAKGRDGPVFPYAILKELVEAMEALGAFPPMADVQLAFLEGDIGKGAVGLKIEGCEAANVHGLMAAKMPQSQDEAGSYSPS
jgi:hypothetical protein